MKIAVGAHQGDPQILARPVPLQTSGWSSPEWTGRVDRWGHFNETVFTVHVNKAASTPLGAHYSRASKAHDSTNPSLHPGNFLVAHEAAFDQSRSWGVLDVDQPCSPDKTTPHRTCGLIRRYRKALRYSLTVHVQRAVPSAASSFTARKFSSLDEVLSKPATRGAPSVRKIAADSMDSRSPLSYCQTGEFERRLQGKPAS